MSAHQDAVRRVVAVLGPDGARDLLKLSTPPMLRAPTRSGNYMSAGGHEALLDTPHDLEADPVMRGWLAEHLRLELEET